MIISVDFDGTVVKHAFPEIGDDIGAVPVLQEIVKNGHQIILNTMRSHKLVNGRDTLQEAINWFSANNIELFGVNENPTQYTWTSSTKPFANLIIDDSAVGCPLLKDVNGRVFVDWEVIKSYFKALNII